MVKKNMAIVAVLLVGGFIFAFAYLTSYRAQGLKQYFYQSQFEQAVMQACGKGFSRFEPNERPESLSNFLNQKTDQFSCLDIPPHASLQYTSNANAWRWMLSSAALIWGIFDVSWPALDILVALLYSISVCFIYGIFRLGMGNLLAIPATVLLAVSPFHLSELPYLRDYSKAPFMLGSFFILGLLVSRPLNNRSLFFCAAILGGLLGVGYGFRPDVIIATPFVAATLLFLLPGHIKKSLARNSLLLGVFSLTFLLFAFPILSAISEMGGCHYHFGLIGLSLPKTQWLQIIPSQLYDFVLGTDAMVRTYVESHGTRNLAIPVGFCSKNYDLASKDLYFEIFKTFPADFVLRAYSSIRQVLEMPFNWTVNPSVTPTWYVPFGNLMISFQSFFKNASYVAVPVILALLVKDLKIGIFAFLWILLFCGYPAIQFDPRHFFYLEFVSWWLLLAFVGYVIGSLANWSLFMALITKKTVLALARKVALYAASIAALLSIPLILLRIEQTAQVEELINAYQAADKLPILTQPVRSDDTVRWALPPLRENAQANTDGGGYRINEMMLHLQVGGEACASKSVPLTVRFNALNPALDFSRFFELHIPADGSYTDIYTPLYELHNPSSGMQYFSPNAVELKSADYLCIKAIDAIVDKNFYPLWLTLAIPQNWKQQRLYQTCQNPMCRR